MSGFGASGHSYESAGNNYQGAAADHPKPAVRLNWARMAAIEPEADILRLRSKR